MSHLPCFFSKGNWERSKSQAARLIALLHPLAFKWDCFKIIRDPVYLRQMNHATYCYYFFYWSISIDLLFDCLQDRKCLYSWLGGCFSYPTGSEIYLIYPQWILTEAFSMSPGYARALGANQERFWVPWYTNDFLNRQKNKNKTKKT